MRFFLFMALSWGLAFFLSLSMALACPIENLYDIPHKNGSTLNLVFEPTEDDRFYIGVEVVSPVDATTQLSVYRSRVSSKLPQTQCGFRTSMQGTQTSVTDGNWRLLTPITSRKYLCLKTKWICCKWLKCRTCWASWIDEDIGFRKTLDLTTRLVPQTSWAHLENGKIENRVSIDAISHLESLEYWEVALLTHMRNLADALSLITFNLIDFSNHLEVEFPDLPLFNELIASHSGFSDPNFLPKIVDARFVDGPALTLVSYLRDENSRKCSVAEEVFLRFKGQSFVHNQVKPTEESYFVSPGDSLIKISKEFYGDTRLHLALAKYNNIAIEAPIIPGQELKLPSIRKLSDTYPRVVSKGDSLWSIAKADPAEYSRLVSQMKSVGRNPDLIFPLDVLK